jgi:hypothetical protein
MGFRRLSIRCESTAISVLIVCWAAPSAVLGPVMGICVDRIDARRSLVLGYVAGAATALGMAACESLGQFDVAVSRALARPATNFSLRAAAFREHNFAHQTQLIVEVGLGEVVVHRWCFPLRADAIRPTYHKERRLSP